MEKVASPEPKRGLDSGRMLSEARAPQIGGPGHEAKEPNPMIHVRIGNTRNFCYMNAVLKCLSFGLPSW